MQHHSTSLSVSLCLGASLAMTIASYAQDSKASPPSNTSATHTEPALTLASAKSVYLAAELGDVVRSGLGRGFPNAERAQAGLRDAVGKWARFTIVDAPEKADLVLVIVEGNRNSG